MIHRARSRGLWLCLVMGLVACGSDDNGDDAGAGDDSGADEGGPMPGDAPVSCGDDDDPDVLSCAAGEACCAKLGMDVDLSCESSCPQDSIGWACEGPSDCPGATECCGNLSTDKGFECWSSCRADQAIACKDSDECPASEPCCQPLVVNGNSYGVCSDNDFGCL